MKLPKSIFREYDIRGVVGTELTDDFAYVLGRAYGSLARDTQHNTIAIGYDCRLSSPGFAESLAKGMSAEGIDSTIIGMGPTPQAYWAVFNKNFGGCIQVTGSHNPPDMNGFKICLGKETLSGDQIQDLYNRALKVIDTDPANTPGKTTSISVIDEYIADLVAKVKPFIGTRKIKVVVDAGNGVSGMVGPEVLRQLGAEVIELYCEPDGNFPNHHPDPTVLENIEELREAVVKHKADFGIGWDGDGDRIGAVDEKGGVIFGDMLLLLYARSILAEEKGASIICDVKCSSLLMDDIASHGGNPIMWKTGHSLVKKKLKETGAALAGEMSGHIFFKHRFYGFDDAQYCSARLLELVSNTEKPVSALLADLPQMVSTPEIRIDCPEDLKFQVAEAAQKAFPNNKTLTIDGVRVEFEKGWGLVRASNTQPVLVMRFEAQSQELLETYRTKVVDVIEGIKASLAQ
jgi:phosphomannomutase / phosphoglucomutase